MGQAYTYCRSCDGGVPMATWAEIKADEQECPHCKALLKPNRTADEIVDELIESVERLQSEIAPATSAKTIENLMDSVEKLESRLQSTNEALLSAISIIQSSAKSGFWPPEKVDLAELNVLAGEVKDQAATTE